MNQANDDTSVWTNWRSVGNISEAVVSVLSVNEIINMRNDVITVTTITIINRDSGSEPILF